MKNIKIKPLTQVNLESSVETYTEIFRESSYYVHAKKKVRGLHEIIANKFQNKFKNKRVLDIGCGYGRFSLLSSQVAKEVIGIDFMKNAIDIANTFKNYFEINNAKFINVSLEEYVPKDNFDFIILSGTLEHIIKYKKMIKKISTLLNKNGTFISDSPSEFNPRGNAQSQLWKLFDMPVTLTDVRMVTPNFMENIAIKHGFKLNKNFIGTLYRRGWGKVGYEDLIKRIPKVVKDFKKIKYDPLIKRNNYEDYFKWLLEQFNFGDNLIKQWAVEKKLKKIKSFTPKRKFIIKRDFQSKLIKAEDAKIYLANDFRYDEYFSDDPLISKFGGNIIYELKKII